MGCSVDMCIAVFNSYHVSEVALHMKRPKAASEMSMEFRSDFLCFKWFVLCSAMVRFSRGV